MLFSLNYFSLGHQKYQKGLSVVELLVSMVISMAVVAGAVEIVVSSKRSFLDQDEVTFIQTNARYALDLISKDVRMAGYLGCATQESAMVANSVEDDAGGYISSHGLIGFEGEVNTDTFPADFKDIAAVGTDAILLRRASNANELDVKKHNAHSAVIDIWGNHSYEKGSTLMIADATCRNVGIFQVSGPNGLPANHVNHNTGSGTNNCTKIVKGNFVCDASCKSQECGGYDAAAGGYGPGSKIMEFVAHAYFIGDSALIPGLPALKRRTLNVNGAPSTNEEEIAIGVEDMELLYGVDNNGDGSVDQYRNAGQMDLNGDSTISNDEWDQVSNVKISLVFRSQKPVLSSAEKRNLAGKEYNDKFLRQLVNTTVKIRNRG